MNPQDDSTFVKTFSIIIIGLLVVTAVLISISVILRSEPDPIANPSQQQFIEERLAPLTGVHQGADGQAALAAAAAEAQATAASAESGPVDGEQVYNTVCMACHAAGVAGAPKPGSEELTKRFADEGIDGMLHNAINGLNVMPPRGGRPDLSDEQIQAAIEFMLQ